MPELGKLRALSAMELCGPVNTRGVSLVVSKKVPIEAGGTWFGYSK